MTTNNIKLVLTDEAKFELAAEGVYAYSKECKLLYDRTNNLFGVWMKGDLPEFYSSMDYLINRENSLRYWFEIYVMKNNKKRVIFETTDIDIAEQISREEAGYISIVVDVSEKNLVYYGFNKHEL